MRFTAKKLEYLVVHPRVFMRAIILSDIDFSNLKKYSLSKWFQLYQMTVFLKRIKPSHGSFLKNFYHKFSNGFLFELLVGYVIDFYSPFSEKSFNPLCSVTKCIIILKITSLLPNQFFIERMRTLSRISMYICTLVVDVKSAISAGPSEDT